MELLQIEGVKPTLAELEKFEDNPDSVDIEVNEISSKVRFFHIFWSTDHFSNIFLRCIPCFSR